MKRFIYRYNPIYHKSAAIRIICEVLKDVPNNKVVFVFMNQDIEALLKSGPGVYYIAKELPSGIKILDSSVHHYFYLIKVINKKKRIQRFVIPRNPNVIR